VKIEQRKSVVDAVVAVMSVVGRYVGCARGNAPGDYRRRRDDEERVKHGTPGIFLLVWDAHPHAPCQMSTV